MTIRLRFSFPIFNDLKNRIQRVCSVLLLYLTITSPFFPLPSLLSLFHLYLSLPSFTYFDSYYIFSKSSLHQLTSIFIFTPIIILHPYPLSHSIPFYSIPFHSSPSKIPPSLLNIAFLSFNSHGVNFRMCIFPVLDLHRSVRQHHIRDFQKRLRKDNNIIEQIFRRMQHENELR